jgi:YidC/Oxa1 family membrane protein insertase
VSSRLPNWLSQKRSGVKNVDQATKEAMKKSNKTQTIMTVVFVIIGLTAPVLLGLYWAYSGLYTIGLTLVQDHLARIKHHKQELGLPTKTMQERLMFWT